MVAGTSKNKNVEQLVFRVADAESKRVAVAQLVRERALSQVIVFTSCPADDAGFVVSGHQKHPPARSQASAQLVWQRRLNHNALRQRCTKKRSSRKRRRFMQSPRPT